MVKLRVDALLKEKNKTKYWLAKKMDSSPGTVNKLVRGESEGVRLETLDKLLKAFECEIQELFLVEKDK